NNYIDFSLFNLDAGLSFNNPNKYILILDILNFNSDIIFNLKWQWLQLGFSYGYDFLNKIDNRLLPLIYGKIGYSSAEPDGTVFGNIISKYNRTFSNFEMNGGINITYLFNPIELELNAEYRNINTEPDLDIFSSHFKISYQNNFIREYKVNENYYHSIIRHFNIYVLGEYNKIYISNISQSAFNLGLGLDYYFK
ncbi:MAG: hypothetical protein ABSG15_12615, partial [FCB group bacterium]